MAKNRSLDHRRDNRTVKKFTTDIKTSTKRENIWSKIVKEEIIERGFRVEIKDNGVDNSGNLVVKSTKKMSNLDNIIIINGTEIPMDIKTNDRGMDYDKVPCMTIKVSSIRAAISVNGRLIVVDRDYWIVFRKDVLTKMLEEIQPAIYHEFSPNDLCIRIYNKSFSDYLVLDKKIEGKAEVKRWGTKAKEMIKDNEKMLFKKRK